MASKKRGLGRGLDALLGIGAEQLATEEANGEQLKAIPLDLIQRGQFQPRLDIKAESLQELADSIKAQGVVQPVLVRPVGDGGRYELVAGERRWRAAQIAGLNTIPAVIRQVTGAEAMSIALIENIQREQLNPIEEAAALDRLVREFDMTHERVAKSIGRSRAAVSNLLRLLDLESATRELLESGELEMGHARALLGLSALIQVKAARRIVSEGLSVRAAEALVRRLKERKHERENTPKKVDPNISQLERSLGERLGADVSIQHRSTGKGSLTIRYGSLDELDGILAHIK
ncbi:MAG: ParB/RepB/Spo0J family partition protein [Gammaproteobacteria bacterium]|nr:ParB/RepB/Spo0J family partition protein [Gammaproteobacteria bacterium]